jgi:pimeloyl-ACP methyl ester carboxylesterase
LGFEQFTLMGHSMGAGISTLVAGTFPERIPRVIFLEGLGPLTGSVETGPDNLKRHISQGNQLRSKQLKPYPSRDAAREILIKATGVSDSSAVSLIDRGMVQADGGGFLWRSDPRMRQRSASRLTEPQVLAFIDQIMSPSLLITASEGILFGHEIMMERRKRVEGLEHHELEGNHHVHMEHPNDVAPLVLDFLSRHAGEP